MDEDIRLNAIHRVKSLIQPKPHCPSGINPRRAFAVKSWIVPQQGEEVEHHKQKSRQGDLPCLLLSYHIISNQTRALGLTAFGLRVIRKQSVRWAKKKKKRYHYSRHRHWETSNHTFVVEGLEDKPAHGWMVNSGILVALEIWQLMLANVDHSVQVTRIEGSNWNASRTKWDRSGGPPIRRRLRIMRNYYNNCIRQRECIDSWYMMIVGVEEPATKQ